MAGLGQFDTAFKNAYIAMDQLIMLPQSQMELQILSENTHRHQKTTPEKSWKSNGASLKSKGMFFLLFLRTIENFYVFNKNNEMITRKVIDKFLMLKLKTPRLWITRVRAK
jgi:hypothetical protein